MLALFFADLTLVLCLVAISFWARRNRGNDGLDRQSPCKPGRG